MLIVEFINLIISDRIGRAENVEVLHSAKRKKEKEKEKKKKKEKRKTLRRVKQRKATWIGRILRKNCFLKTVIEGNIEGKSR